jgi:hypothetical protein
MQIIDYQVQRYRLFKQLSIAYAIKFTGSWMISKFKELESEGSRLGKVDNLTEVAATSAGLKAMCTYLAWFGIEDCRKCCGGNGYLMAGGIASLAADYVWQTTAEGDYIVMMLQTAQVQKQNFTNTSTFSHIQCTLPFIIILNMIVHTDHTSDSCTYSKTLENEKVGWFQYDTEVEFFCLCLVLVENASKRSPREEVSGCCFISLGLTTTRIQLEQMCTF